MKSIQRKRTGSAPQPAIENKRTRASHREALNEDVDDHSTSKRRKVAKQVSVLPRSHSDVC